MRRLAAGALAVAVVGMTLVVLASAPATGTASVSPGGATVTAGSGTTARASFSPSGAVTCPSLSGGGNGVSGTLDSTGCRDTAFSTTLRVSSSTSAAPGNYTFTLTDTADGGTATFTLTVRPQPTTTAPPPTTTPPPPPTTTAAPPPPPTTAAPTTVAPATTAAPTTAPPETTTTVVVEAGVFASVESLVAAGMPAQAAFLPLKGAGFRDCFPLRAACGDPDSGLLLLPAPDTALSWATEPEGATPPPQANLRDVPALQPVGTPPAEPGAVNYALTILDLADNGQLKRLPRGLSSSGEFVAPTSDQQLLSLTVAGVTVPEGLRTFLASAPFDKPYRIDTTSVVEAQPTIPMFLSTTRRVLYGVRPDPTWDVGAEVMPLLGGGAVPHLVRLADGPPGLVVPISPGLQLADRGDVQAAATDEDDGGGGIPVLALIAIAAAAVVAGAVIAVMRRRNRPEPVAGLSDTLPFGHDVRRPGPNDPKPRL